MLIVTAIAFIWGLAEGLWFFIIPDVALSFIAIKGIRRATVATAAVLVGSMLAALILYASAEYAPSYLDTLQKVWSHLPGYYKKMFEVARGHLNTNGARGMLSGPTSGIPYRFYLYEAVQQNISLWQILLWTPLARLERIVLAPLGVLALRFVTMKLNAKYSWTTELKLNRILFAAISIYWIGIYVWYWGIFLPTTYSAIAN